MNQINPDRRWIALAILSGTFAAVNGAFAKLTTTAHTTSWARTIASTTRLDDHARAVEYAVRAAFFILNMAFNGVMWGLFTRALALSPSAVRVNVINTASNFLLTAVLGSGVFGERLPALWFVGAAMLVAGSVIIGARQGTEDEAADGLKGHVVDEGKAKATGSETVTHTSNEQQDTVRKSPRKRKPRSES